MTKKTQQTTAPLNKIMLKENMLKNNPQQIYILKATSICDVGGSDLVDSSQRVHVGKNADGQHVLNIHI